MADAITIKALQDASLDAKSLSEFVFKPASFMVQRRLAPAINTLQYYLDLFENISIGGEFNSAKIESLTVNTGAAGTEAAVITGGTPSNRSFALTIPKGDKGVDGKSAYQSALDNGFIGTEAEWQLYLKSDGSIQALQQFMTNPASTEVSVPDYGNIPSLQGYISTMFENGGLPATPFKTKALMTASSLANDKYAVVTDDTVNNGLYVKTAGVWVKSDYDPVAQANQRTDFVYKEIADSKVISPSYIDFSFKRGGYSAELGYEENKTRLVTNILHLDGKNVSCFINDGYELYLYVSNDGVSFTPSGGWRGNGKTLRIEGVPYAIIVARNTLKVTAPIYPNEVTLTTTPHYHSKYVSDSLFAGINRDTVLVGADGIIVEERKTVIKKNQHVTLTLRNTGLTNKSGNELDTALSVGFRNLADDTWIHQPILITGSTAKLEQEYIVKWVALEDCMVRIQGRWAANERMNINIHVPNILDTLQANNLVSESTYDIVGEGPEIFDFYPRALSKGDIVKIHLTNTGLINKTPGNAVSTVLAVGFRNLADDTWLYEPILLQGPTAEIKKEYVVQWIAPEDCIILIQGRYEGTLTANIKVEKPIDLQVIENTLSISNIEQQVTDNTDAISQLGFSGNYSREYEGEKLSAVRHKYDISDFVSLQSLSGHIVQAGDAHNGIAFIGHDTGAFRVLNASDGAEITTFNLASAHTSLHCGNVNFGGEYPTGNAQYPALYASGDLTTLTCYVESISLDIESKVASSTLIQTLDFSAINPSMSGSQVIIDKDNNFIWYMQRVTSNINSFDNKLNICKFRLPSLSEGTDVVDSFGEYKKVTFLESDKLDEFILPVWMPVYQGAKIINGKLIQTGGMTGVHKPYIAVRAFDLYSNKQTAYIDLSHVNVEPQGVYDFNGDFYIIFNSKIMKLKT